MTTSILNAIAEGGANIAITLNLADLRTVVMEVVAQERQRIQQAVANSRDIPMLTRRQAAERLNVSLSTIDRWAKDGYITPVKVGAKVLYRASDLDLDNLP